MSDDHKFHFYVPFGEIDQNAHTVQLHLRGARMDSEAGSSGPADVAELERALIEYMKRDGSVAAPHHQNAARLIPSRTGFAIRVTDARSWLRVANSSDTAVQVHCDSRKGALAIASIELCSTPRPNQEKAATTSFTKGANMNDSDSRYSGSIYKVIDDFKKALAESRAHPIYSHDRDGGRVDNSRPLAKVRDTSTFSKAVDTALASPRQTLGRTVGGFRQPADSIPGNYSATGMSPGAKRIHDLLHADTSKGLNADQIEMLGEITKLLEDGEGGASFSKGSENPAYSDSGWKPILADAADGMRALPLTQDQVRSATNELYAADHFHCETVDAHRNMPAVHRCKAHIKKAIYHCEKGAVREGFRAVADAMDAHGRVVTVLPGDQNVARVGLALSTAYQFLDKAINIGMALGPEGGSMSLAVPGGSDKAAGARPMLDANGLVPGFQKMVSNARRTSLAHDTGGRR